MDELQQDLSSDNSVLPVTTRVFELACQFHAAEQQRQIEYPLMAGELLPRAHSARQANRHLAWVIFCDGDLARSSNFSPPASQTTVPRFSPRRWSLAKERSQTWPSPHVLTSTAT